MTTQTTPLPGHPAADSSVQHAPTSAEHHRREEPDEHLCTCGRLRAECVRDSVREIWDES
jgi:hypothetical protein